MKIIQTQGGATLVIPLDRKLLAPGGRSAYIQEIMSEDHNGPMKAYDNEDFLGSREARPLRIMSEYLEPKARFEEFNIADTIVFFGSARIPSREAALNGLKAARESGVGIEAAECALKMSAYYEDARGLARRLTEWSKGLEKKTQRFVVCTGGGPGIMEAANRGASEAKGVNIGLNIAIPFEQEENIYVTRELSFKFNYFFMRKFWFTYLAKAMVIFPGGYGTLDEFFELMTLIQTRKLIKKMPIVLYSAGYWSEVINFKAMVSHGVILESDLDLFKIANSVGEAFEFIVKNLAAAALKEPGGSL